MGTKPPPSSLIRLMTNQRKHRLAVFRYPSFENSNDVMATVPFDVAFAAGIIAIVVFIVQINVVLHSRTIAIHD